MRKSILVQSSNTVKPARAVRLANGKSRTMPQDGLSITAATNSPRLDVTHWLDAAQTGGSIGGGMARAVAGGAQATAVGSSQLPTVALSDVTRITFAVAGSPQEMELA